MKQECFLDVYLQQVMTSTNFHFNGSKSLQIQQLITIQIELITYVKSILISEFKMLLIKDSYFDFIFHFHINTILQSAF